MEKDKQPALLPNPEPRYATKSPGMLVRFGDGKSVHMNRATRRKNKLYANRLKMVKR